MKVDRGTDGDGSFTTSWTRQSGRQTFYLYVGPYDIEWGSHYGTGQTDASINIPHEEFLGGEHQDGIAHDFGKDVLQEVLRTVRHSHQVPRFAREWRDAERRLKFWKSIPIDPELCRLAAKPNDQGKSRYCNIKLADGSYETEVREGTVVLRLDGWHARFTFPRKGPVFLKQKSVDLRGNHSAVLAHKSRFYVADNYLEVFDIRGRRLFSTVDLEETSGLGTLYRIDDVVRAGDRVMAVYSDYHFNPRVDEIGDKGYLEIDVSRGIIARCHA